MLKPNRSQIRRLRELVRHFKENGIKLLLEHPGNVREMLMVTGSPLVRLVDFSGLKVLKTHFVRRDYSHVESDIVLSAPLLSKDGRRLRQRVLIYILIEHRSEPDRLIPLRVTDYQLQIFNYQKRQWAKRYKSLAKFRLEPVLPVVFYTGTRPWPSLGSVSDLMEQGAEFRSVTAGIEAPLFILAGTPRRSTDGKRGVFRSRAATDPATPRPDRRVSTPAPANRAASRNNVPHRKTSRARLVVLYSCSRRPRTGTQ